MKQFSKLKNRVIHKLAINLGYTPIEDIIRVFGGIPKIYPDGGVLKQYSLKGEGKNYFKLGPYGRLYEKIIFGHDNGANWLYFYPEDFVECKTNNLEEIRYYIKQIKELRERKKCLASGFNEIDTSGFC